MLEAFLAARKSGVMGETIYCSMNQTIEWVSDVIWYGVSVLCFYCRFVLHLIISLCFQVVLFITALTHLCTYCCSCKNWLFVCDLIMLIPYYNSLLLIVLFIVWEMVFLFCRFVVYLIISLCFQVVLFITVLIVLLISVHVKLAICVWFDHVDTIL